MTSCYSCYIHSQTLQTVTFTSEMTLGLSGSIAHGVYIHIHIAEAGVHVQLMQHDVMVSSIIYIFILYNHFHLAYMLVTKLTCMCTLYIPYRGTQ